jgi:hypothetical protein
MDAGDIYHAPTDALQLSQETSHEKKWRHDIDTQHLLPIVSSDRFRWLEELERRVVDQDMQAITTQQGVDLSGLAGQILFLAGAPFEIALDVFIAHNLGGRL